MTKTVINLGAAHTYIARPYKEVRYPPPPQGHKAKRRRGGFKDVRAHCYCASLVRTL